MSEYQFVAFWAIDRPLDERQLAFAEKQSSHSQLSKWEMTVKYHYSSFGGNVDGLMRRGFGSRPPISLRGCKGRQSRSRLREKNGKSPSHSQHAQIIPSQTRSSRLSMTGEPAGVATGLAMFGPLYCERKLNAKTSNDSKGD